MSNDYSPLYSDEDDELSEGDRNLLESTKKNTEIQVNKTKIEETTPGKRKIRTWLTKTFRIVMTDGRVLIGEFLCTDADANVVLGMVHEYTQINQKLGNERYVGLVMVPGRHIVSIEVDVSRRNIDNVN